jgi:hypothetical protein
MFEACPQLPTPELETVTELDSSWPEGLDITGRPQIKGVIDANFVEALEKESDNFTADLVVYALELSGKLTPLDQLASIEDDVELQKELYKRDYINEKARYASHLCDQYSYTQLQGKLKEETAAFTSPSNLSTTPPIIKMINSFEKKNYIGPFVRRKAEGVVRILILLQQREEEKIPKPTFEKDTRLQKGP